MKKLANITAFAGAMVFGTAVSPAMAEGFYGALDAGSAKGKDICVGLTSACEDTATLYRGAGGYEFTTMWSAEISYGASRKASAGTIVPGFAGSWETDVLQVSGIGTFPLGGGFALTGKLGIARTDITLTVAGFGASASSSSSTTQASFGVGARYDFTDRFAIRAQYEDMGTIGDANTTGEYKATLISAGLVFRF